MQKKLLLSLLLSVSFLLLTAQDTLTGYYGDFVLVPQNRTYLPNIKTVQLYNETSERSYPLIHLGSNEKLVLTFDDMHAGVKDYQYTVEHYNHNWTEKDLRPYEYLEGFETDLIENYESSLGTDVPYTHYELRFPTEYLRITKSGNYLLKVFDGVETENNVILTHRFMVEEGHANVDGKIKKAFTSADMAGFNQQLELNINPKGQQLINPHQSVKLVVTQNRRWDNARYEVKPNTVRGSTIEYFNNPALVFHSGNEFRNFDTKDLNHITEYIQDIESTPMGYNVILKPALRRAFSSYVTEDDLNGLRLIRARTGLDPDTEAEYTDVYFYLPYDVPVGMGDFYLIGEITAWTLDPDGKMKYNYETDGYEAHMLLKQGYYEFQYGFVFEGENAADVTLIEGNFFETDNEYMVYVYYREPGTFYDRLIGTGLIKRN